MRFGCSAPIVWVDESPSGALRSTEHVTTVHHRRRWPPSGIHVEMVTALLPTVPVLSALSSRAGARNHTFAGRPDVVDSLRPKQLPRHERKTTNDRTTTTDSRRPSAVAARATSEMTPC